MNQQPSETHEVDEEGFESTLSDHTLFLTILSLVLIGSGITFGTASYLLAPRDAQPAYLLGGYGDLALRADGDGDTSSTGSGNTSNVGGGGGGGGGGDAGAGNRGSSVGSSVGSGNGTNAPGNASSPSGGGNTPNNGGNTSSGGSPGGSNGDGDGDTGRDGGIRDSAGNGNGGNAPSSQQQQATRSQELRDSLSQAAKSAVSNLGGVTKVSETISRVTGAALGGLFGGPMGAVTGAMNSPVSPKTVSEAISRISQSGPAPSAPTTGTGLRGPTGPNGEPQTPEQARQQAAAQPPVNAAVGEEMKKVPGRFGGISIPAPAQPNPNVTKVATEITTVPVKTMYKTGRKVTTVDGDVLDEITDDPTKAAPGAVPEKKVPTRVVDTVTGQVTIVNRPATPDEIQRGFANLTRTVSDEELSRTGSFAPAQDARTAETAARTNARTAAEAQARAEAAQGQATDARTNARTAAEAQARAEAAQGQATDARTDARTTAEAQARTEVSRGQATDTRTDARTSAEAQARAEAAQGQATDARTNARTAAEAQARTTEKAAEAKARAAAQGQATDARTDARTSAEAQARTEVSRGQSTDARTDARTAAEAQARAEAAQGQATDARTDARTTAEAQARAAAAQGQATDARTDARTSAEAQARAAAAQGQATDARTDARTSAEAQARAAAAQGQATDARTDARTAAEAQARAAEAEQKAAEAKAARDAAVAETNRDIRSDDSVKRTAPAVPAQRAVGTEVVETKPVGQQQPAKATAPAAQRDTTPDDDREGGDGGGVLPGSTGNDRLEDARPTDVFLNEEKAAKLAKLKADEARLLRQAEKLQEILGGKISLGDAVVAVNEIIRTTIGEAGEEHSKEHQVAVANTIMNRIKLAAATQENVSIHKVLDGFDANMQAPRTKKIEGVNYALADIGTTGHDTASEAVSDVLDGKLPADMPEAVRNATHYYTGPKPYWADGATQTKYGPHNFLNPDKGKEASVVAEARAAIDEGEVKADIEFGGTAADIANEVARARKIAEKYQDRQQISGPDTRVATAPTAEVVTLATLEPQTDATPDGGVQPSGEVQVEPASANLKGKSIVAVSRAVPSAAQQEQTESAYVDDKEWTAPVHGGRIYGASSGYGPRTRSKNGKQYASFHFGEDHYPANYRNPNDRKVSAMKEGVVAAINKASSGYGEYVSIKHADGKYSRYAHISVDSDLKVGDEVKQGQEIGKISGAGTAFGGQVASIMKKEGLSKDAAYQKAIEQNTDANGKWTGGVTPPHTHVEITTQPTGPGSVVAINPASVGAATERGAVNTPGKASPVGTNVASQTSGAGTAEASGEDESLSLTIASLENVTPKVEAAKQKAAEVAQTVTETVDTELKKTMDSIDGQLKAGKIAFDKGLEAAMEAAKEAGVTLEFKQFDPSLPTPYHYTVPSNMIPREGLTTWQTMKLAAVSTVEIGVYVPDSALTKTVTKTVEQPTTVPPAGEIPGPETTPGTTETPAPGTGTTPTHQVKGIDGTPLANVKKEADGTLTLSGPQPQTTAPNGDKPVEIDGKEYDVKYKDGKAVDIKPAAPKNETPDNPPPATEEEEVKAPPKKPDGPIMKNIKRILEWLGFGGDDTPNGTEIGTTTRAQN